VVPVAYDPEKALRLAREAGIADGVTIKTSPPTSRRFPKVAEAVAEDLARIAYGSIFAVTTTHRGGRSSTWIRIASCVSGDGTATASDFLFRREYMTAGRLTRHVTAMRRSTNYSSARGSPSKQAEQVRLYKEAQRILRVTCRCCVIFNGHTRRWRPGVQGYRPHPMQYWTSRTPCVH